MVHEKLEQKCELCHKIFHPETNLKNHVNVVHEKLKPYSCEFCDISFTNTHENCTQKTKTT